MAKQETLKNQILRESVAILGKNGFAGLSLREVAKKLKVTHQAPYHYFPDKEALLLELKKDGFQQLSLAMEAAFNKEEDPFLQLEAIGMTYFDFCVQNPGYFRAMFGSNSQGENVRVAEAEKAFSLLVRGIQQLQSKGLLQQQSPEIIAMICWTSLHGMVALIMEKYPVMGGRFNSRDLAQKIMRTLHGLYGKPQQG